MIEKHIKKLSLLIVIVMVFGVFTACSKEDLDNGEKAIEDENIEEVGETSSDLYPLEIEDGFGESWIFEKEPERIVSLSPNDTEILFALDLDDKIVGVSDFADYPEEALEIERIGDAQVINLERIIELETDLVINYGFTAEEDIMRLKEAGIKVWGYQPESIDEILETIRDIGDITNRQDEASVLIADMENKRDEIIEKLEGVEKKKVFYEIWNDPLMAAGPGSFMDELINLAGGVNVASDAEKGYVNYDLESLIEKDPEVYLSSDHIVDQTQESIANRPGYSEMEAVKQGNVYFLDGNIVSRPGPRIIEALELVAKAIHPEIFN